MNYKKILTELPEDYIRAVDIESQKTGKKKKQITKEAFELRLFGRIK